MSAAKRYDSLRSAKAALSAKQPPRRQRRAMRTQYHPAQFFNRGNIIKRRRKEHPPADVPP